MADTHRHGRGSAKILRALVGSALLLGVIAMIIGFSAASPLFLTVSNSREMFLEGSVLAIVAAPVAILVLMGMIDLSVGSTIGVGGVIAGQLIAVEHVNPIVATVAALLCGAVIGLVNGLLVGFLRWSPIVVTLGMLTALRGLAQVIAVNTPSGFGSGFDWLGSGIVGGMPVPAIFAVATMLVAGAFLYGTPWGRHTYAIGVNRDAAFLSGVGVRWLPVVAFVLTGIAAAFGGVLEAGRLNAAPAGTMGTGFELTVLTAVLLGGVAFEGGRGTLFGVVLGVVFLEVLQNGLTLLNVQNSYQQMANGLALVIAAALNFAAQRNGTSGGLTAIFDLVRDRRADVSRAPRHRVELPSHEDTPVGPTPIEA